MKRALAGAAAALALAALIASRTGGGRFAIFAEGKPLDVTVDGDPVGRVEPYSSRWFDISHGNHVVRVGKIEHGLEVSRGFEQVLPIGQCFVAFDVTNLLYAPTGGARDEPAVFDNPVAARFFSGEPFELPERTWLTLAELPKERSYTERASVLRLVPCSKRDATDEELADLAPRAGDF